MLSWLGIVNSVTTLMTKLVSPLRFNILYYDEILKVFHVILAQRQDVNKRELFINLAAMLPIGENFL